MKPGTVKINNRSFEYKFNNKARRLFMQHYGLEFFDEYIEKVEEMKPDPKRGISLAGLDIMSNLFVTAIEACQPFDGFDKDDLIDHLMDNQDEMEKIMSEFAKQQEQVKGKGQKPANKSTSTTRRSGGKS